MRTTTDRWLGRLQDGLCGLAVAAAVVAGLSGGAAMGISGQPGGPVTADPCANQPLCKRIDGVCTSGTDDENCDKRRRECTCSLYYGDCACIP